MVKKSHLNIQQKSTNIVKRGYSDCKLDKKALFKALKNESSFFVVIIQHLRCF